MTTAGDLEVEGDFTVGGDLTVMGDVTAAGNLAVGGELIAEENETPAMNATVRGDSHDRGERDRG